MVEVCLDCESSWRPGILDEARHEATSSYVNVLRKTAIWC